MSKTHFVRLVPIGDMRQAGYITMFHRQKLERSEAGVAPDSMGGLSALETSNGTVLRNGSSPVVCERGLPLGLVSSLLSSGAPEGAPNLHLADNCGRIQSTTALAAFLSIMAAPPSSNAAMAQKATVGSESAYPGSESTGADAPCSIQGVFGHYWVFAERRRLDNESRERPAPGG